jgi:hypothetical protein
MGHCPLQGGGRWFEPSIAHSQYRIGTRNTRKRNAPGDEPGVRTEGVIAFGPVDPNQPFELSLP